MTRKTQNAGRIRDFEQGARITAGRDSRPEWSGLDFATELNDWQTCWY